MWIAIAVVVILFAAFGKTSWPAAGLFCVGAILGTLFYVVGPYPIVSWSCVIPCWIGAAVLDTRWRNAKKAEEEAASDSD